LSLTNYVKFILEVNFLMDILKLCVWYAFCLYNLGLLFVLLSVCLFYLTLLYFPYFLNLHLFYSTLFGGTSAQKTEESCKTDFDSRFGGIEATGDSSAWTTG